MAMNQVFAGITVDTDSGAFINTAGPRTLIVLASGTFDSGTVAIELSGDDGTTFVPMPGGLTADGTLEQTIPDECQARISLNGSTAATVSVWSNLSIPSS